MTIVRIYFRPLPGGSEQQIDMGMEDPQARELLATQEDWWRLMKGASLDTFLSMLAGTQGYRSYQFIRAEGVGGVNVREN